MSESKSSQVTVVSTPIIHLVVVELQYHNELLQNLYDTLCLQNFRITLVTLPELLEKTNLMDTADAEKFTAETKRQGESVGEFLSRMRPVFKAADILYFNTVRHFWEELNQIPIQAPGIVRIHNAHCDLAPLTHFKQPWLNCLSILSHLIRKVWLGGEWRLKRSFFAKNGYLMMPNQTITDYVMSNGWEKGFTILPPVLPFAYLPEPKDQKSNTVKSTEADSSKRKTVTVAITGKVTNSKKDFDLVYRAIKQALPQLSQKIKLILLGNARDKHAKSIISNFKSLQGPQFELDYSDAYVPQEVFDEKVREVDFFIAPIKVETHFRKYREIYGKSKVSGVENDILLHRKPSLVITDYPVSPPLDQVVEYFDNNAASLSTKLVEWISNEKPLTLKKSFEHMKGLQKQEIADRFYLLCCDLVKNHKYQRPN